MNRDRNSSGINSYEQEFNFKPESFLAGKIAGFKQASWLDLCCGNGKALIQTANYFDKLGQQEMIKLKGIDLVDTFQQYSKDLTCIEFEARSLIDFTPEASYDLITCVHGLHYIGDKLKVIKSNSQALKSSGLFIANLDLNNIVIQGTNTNRYLKDIFRQHRIEYNSTSKILTHTAPRNIDFLLNYLGADDTCGPNYTGQDAVTSYYSV